MALSFSGITVDNIVVVAGGQYAPVTLPRATGGTTPYTYSLTPDLSDKGVSFNPNTRQLSVFPNQVIPLTTLTYEVMDADSATETLSFTLMVNSRQVVPLEPVINQSDVIIDETEGVETRLEYITVEDETLAGIIYRHYGIANDEILKQVLASNTNFSNYPLVLPQGVTIILPDINITHEIEPIALWE